MRGLAGLVEAPECRPDALRNTSAHPVICVEPGAGVADAPGSSVRRVLCAVGVLQLDRGALEVGGDRGRGDAELLGGVGMRDAPRDDQVDEVALAWGELLRVKSSSASPGSARVVSSRRSMIIDADRNVGPVRGDQLSLPSTMKPLRRQVRILLSRHES